MMSWSIWKEPGLRRQAGVSRSIADYKQIITVTIITVITVIAVIGSFLNGSREGGARLESELGKLPG